jgi:hypothetical protein
MELKLFAEKINLYAALEEKDEHTCVAIPTEDPSVGERSCVGIEMVYSGFDWDTGKIFLVPKEPLKRAYHKSGLTCFEYEYLTNAVQNGFKYICRHPSGMIIISKEIPHRTPRGWKYDKTVSETTMLFRYGLEKLTWENGGVMYIKSLFETGV